MTLGEKISVGPSWSRDEDIAFERSLANYSDETQIRWDKIATVIPGKTIAQIIEHYNMLVRDVMMIESGCVPPPDFPNDFSEKPNHNASDKAISISEHGNKRKREFKPKRKKGIAWTSTEHRQFLLGLERYGKGDWRSISRNCVRTRTSTQVASHAQKYYARLNSKNKNTNRPSIHDVTVPENKYITTKQRLTWQNRNFNGASTSNTQAIQTTMQPSLDLPIHGIPNIWNTQATQAISQPSLWNTQATQAISQPSLWNTQATQAITYGAPTMWNTQAALQPSANIPMYGTSSTISQPMGGPMLSPFGTNMNRLAPPHMTSEVQHYSVPSYSGPSAPTNIDSIPFNMDLYN